MGKFIVTKYVADRRAAIILKALQKLNKEKIKILDVGCGNKYILNKVKKAGYYIIGIDKESPEISSWMKEYPEVVMDATKLAFKDNTFDVIVALEVIEHAPCAPEINRVLKPEGFFFCSTPSPGTDWVRRILVKLKVLEDQDFEHHDHLVDLKNVPMTLRKRRKMFLWTSQFGIFTKKTD